MLAAAYNYRDRLPHIRADLTLDPRFWYYDHAGWSAFDKMVDSDDWLSLQVVSVDSKDRIRGFMSASICRMRYSIDSIHAINFDGQPSVVFARDLFRFLARLLVQYNFEKVSWSVVVGNPAAKMYDKIVRQFGGAVCGYHRKHVKLRDGALYDMQDYEILRDEADLARVRRYA